MSFYACKYCEMIFATRQSWEAHACGTQQTWNPSVGTPMSSGPDAKPQLTEPRPDPEPASTRFLLRQNAELRDQRATLMKGISEMRERLDKISQGYLDAADERDRLRAGLGHLALMDCCDGCKAYALKALAHHPAREESLPGAQFWRKHPAREGEAVTHPPPKSAIHIAQDLVSEWKAKPGMLNMVEDIAEALTQYGNARFEAAAVVLDAQDDLAGQHGWKGIYTQSAARVRALKEPE